MTASLVVYPVGRSHWLELRPRPPSRITDQWSRYSTKKFYEINIYNFTTSIGTPRTACKSDEFDEYEVSPARPAPSTAVPRAPSRTGANRARASRATDGTRGEIRPMRPGSGAGRLSGSRAGARAHGGKASRGTNSSPLCAAPPARGPGRALVRRRGAGDRAGLAFRIDAAALARRHGHAHRPDRMPADVVLPVKLPR